MHIKHADGSQETKVSVAGKTLDEWKAEGERRLAELVRWGRHLLWRSVVAMVGVTFVVSLNPGPWVVTAYVAALMAAGDLSIRLDRRTPNE